MMLSSFSPPSRVPCITASATAASRLRLLSTNASLYEILEIPVGSTSHEIKSAYRRLARICHPDVSVNSSADDFVKIHAAYCTLSDPERRAVYDRRIINPRRRPLTNKVKGYGGRSWETDQCW